MRCRDARAASAAPRSRQTTTRFTVRRLQCKRALRHTQNPKAAPPATAFVVSSENVLSARKLRARHNPRRGERERQTNDLTLLLLCKQAPDELSSSPDLPPPPPLVAAAANRPSRAPLVALQCTTSGELVCFRAADLPRGIRKCEKSLFFW